MHDADSILRSPRETARRRHHQRCARLEPAAVRRRLAMERPVLQTGNGSMKHVVVVGIARGGEEMARCFYELGALHGVCDPDPSSAAAARTPGAAFTTDLDAALRSPEAAGVALAGPVDRRFETAKAALDAGKHVFSAPPVALERRQVETLRRLADERGCILMVSRSVRRGPGARALKESIEDGRLGELRDVFITHLFPDGPEAHWGRAGEDVCLLLWLLGETPTEASWKDWEGGGGGGAAFLRFQSGAAAHVFLCGGAAGEELRLTASGEKATAAARGAELTIHPRRPGADDAPAEAPAALSLPSDEALRAECADFLGRMAGERKDDGDEEALAAASVLDACRRSAEQGGKPAAVRGALVEPEDESYFVHPTAIIDSPVRIGAGSRIWHFAHVLPNTTIGPRCTLGQNTMVGPDVTIGEGCKIQNNVSVYKGVTLEDYVFCGPSMVFTNVLNPRSEISRKHEFQPTLVKRGATLGANCTIICGHTIGEYAFVGAGAVVTRDAPAYAILLGVPARRVGWMCRCGVKLEFAGGRAVCRACGRRYREAGEERIEPLDA